MHHTIPQSMGKDAESTLSHLHQSLGKSGKVTFWCMRKSSYFGYCLGIHMKSIWHAQKFMCSFIHDEPRWRSWWTQVKIIKNTTTFWSSSFDQNVHPNFQVKACGTQDTWHNTINAPKHNQETSMLKHNCKRLLIKQNYKEIFLTLNTWYTINGVHNTNQIQTLKTLEFLRYELW